MNSSTDTIFIVGPPRSGTTLLLNLLVKDQPDVCGARMESQFYAWKRLHPYKKEVYQDNLYFRRLLSDTEIDDLFERSRGPEEFFRQAVDLTRQKTGKKLFVEKSPIHTLYYDEISRDFPGAKFILMERDPCANVQSLAFTQWIPLIADRLPGFLGKMKTLRYLSAMVVYAHFSLKSDKIATSPNCLLKIRFEDMVMEQINIKEVLEEKLDIDMGELYISRPFSDQVSHREYKLDKSRIESYKRKMPQWIQRLVRLAFERQSGSMRTRQKLIWALFLHPMVFLKRVFGRS